MTDNWQNNMLKLSINLTEVLPDYPKIAYKTHRRLLTVRGFSPFAVARPSQLLTVRGCSPFAVAGRIELLAVRSFWPFAVAGRFLIVTCCQQLLRRSAVVRLFFASVVPCRLGLSPCLLLSLVCLSKFDCDGVC